jgi:dihydrofolate reductase
MPETVGGGWQATGMGKTQYLAAASIDGFIADQGGSLDWLFTAEARASAEADAAKEDRFTQFFAATGAMAMGAATYEWVLDHENLLEQPGKWQEYYGDVRCWVFTHRQLPPIPGARLSFVSGDVRPVHAQMTATAAGRNLWLVGGGELVGQFADHGLLDEILLAVAPVTLGAGAPLLPRRLTAARLALTDCSQDGTFAFLSYAVTQGPAGSEPDPQPQAALAPRVKR